MADNRNEWRGGRSARKREEEESAPAWKQSRKRAETAVGVKRPWTKLLALAAFLSILVVIAIYIVRPEARHLTVVDVFAGFQEPAGDQPLGFMQGGVAIPPEFSEIDDGNQRMGLRQQQDIDDMTADAWSGKFSETRRDFFRRIDGETLILYLQAGVVPGNDGGTESGATLWILNGDSCSPDLDSTQFRDLSQLQAEVETFLKQRKASVLLLIDPPHVEHAFRFGQMGVNFVQNCLDWARARKDGRLVVLAACNDQQVSWPLAMGGQGRTAFAHFARAGMQDVRANADGDRQLRVDEYCKYVKDETEKWVSANRGSGLQTVSMEPREASFILVRNPQLTKTPLPLQSGSKDDAVLEGDLKKGWEKYVQLNETQQAYRWAPLPVISARDRLHMAEVSYLGGEFQSARGMLDEAMKLLDRAETENGLINVKGLNSEQLSTMEQLPMNLFQNLPSYGRLQGVPLWKKSMVDASPQNPPAAPVVEIEGVMGNSYKSWLPEKADPAPQNWSELLAYRSHAETSAALMFGNSAILQNTILKEELRTLTAEDRYFISPGEFEKVPSESDRWAALAGLSRARNQASYLLARSLHELPGYIDWCANSGVTEAEQTRVLLEQLTAEKDASFHWGRLLSNEEGSDLPKNLQRAVLIQIVATRGAAQQFRQLCFAKEPSEGYSTDQLTAQKAALEEWLIRLEEGRRSVQKATEALLQNAVGEGPIYEPAVPVENRLERYHEFRNLLCLNTISADKRSALIALIRKTDHRIAESAEEKTGSESVLTKVCFQRIGKRQLEWYSQAITLHRALTDVDSEAHKQASQLASEFAVAAGQDAGGEDANGQKLQTCGVKFRKFCREQREFMSKVLRDSATPTGEMICLDLKSKLYPAFDADMSAKSQETLAVKCLQRLRDDYCRMQAMRIKSGGWMINGETEPWYLARAREWSKFVKDPGKDGEFLQALGQAKDEWQAEGKFEPNRMRFDTGQQLECRFQVAIKGMGEFDGGIPAVQIQGVPTTEIAGKTLRELQLVGSTEQVGASEQQSTDQRPLFFEAPKSDAPASVGIRLRRGQLLDKDEYGVVQIASKIFFRGREKDGARDGTIVEVDPRQRRSWLWERSLPPQDAKIVLTTKDVRPLAFVLDWSDSMKEPISEASPEIKRNTEATEALKAILKKLRDRNDERAASLRVFGHRVVWNRNDNSKTIPNDSFRSEFANFRFPAGSDVSIDRVKVEEDSQLFVEQMPLGKGFERLDDAISRFESVTPHGVTPLIYSIIRAIRDLDGESGVIVAITDGAPTDARDDPEYKKYNRIAELENAVRNSGRDIQILIVSFAVQDPKVKAQIEAPFMGSEILSNCCTVLDARDRDEIVSTIEDHLSPPPLSVLAEGREPLDIEGVSVSERSLRYEAELPSTNACELQYGRIQGRVESLAAGDQFNMEIDWKSSKFLFNRLNLSRIDLKGAFENAGGVSPNDERPAFLRADQPKILITNGVRELSFQLFLDHDNWKRGPVRRPAEIEFDYKPSRNVDSASFPFAGRVTEIFNRDSGRPSWEVQLTDWPENFVEIQAYYTMTRTAPDCVFGWGEISNSTSPQSGRNTQQLGASENLPVAIVSQSVLDDRRILEIRLSDVKARQGEQTTGLANDGNRVWNIRVELGSRSQKGDNASFLPEQVKAEMERLEGGDVIWRFSRAEQVWSDDVLLGTEVALTSRAKMRNGARKLESPLTITDFAEK